MTGRDAPRRDPDAAPRRAASEGEPGVIQSLEGDAIQKDAEALFLSLCSLPPKTFMDEIPRTSKMFSVDMRAEDLATKWPESVRALAEGVNKTGGEYLAVFYRDSMPAAIHFAGGQWLRLLVQWQPPTTTEDGTLVPEMWAARFDAKVLSRV